MMSKKCFNTLIFLAIFFVAPDFADASMDVWVDHGDIKIRQQGDYNGTGQQLVQDISLKSAKNEFEPFQIFVHAGGEDLTNVDVTISNLTNGTDTIDEIMIYKEGYSNVTQKTRADYQTGNFPNVLFPKVDAYFHETRNAFPFNVGNGNVQGVWIEFGVNASVPAGTYTGTYIVSADGKTPVSGNITLQVWDFNLPSTASQKNLWVIAPSSFETGHFGTSGSGNSTFATYAAWMDWSASMEALYIKAMLYNRVGVSEKAGGGFYTTVAADGTTTFPARWRTAFKDALDGTAITGNKTYAGAKLAVIDFEAAHNTSGLVDSSATKNRQYLQSWWDYFTANGWDPMNRLYAYVWDEPRTTNDAQYAGPYSYRGGSYSAFEIIYAKALDMNAVNTGGQGPWKNTFITEDRNLDMACDSTLGIAEKRKILANLDPSNPYDPPFDDLGFYVTTMQHYEYTNNQFPCYKVARSTYPGYDSWPNYNHWSYIANSNYTIPQVDITTDSPGFWTRAIGWEQWTYRTTGMLYYHTNNSSNFPEPFVESYYHPITSEMIGNGGGTLFYPGVASKAAIPDLNLPARPSLPSSTPEIGGTHDIPLDSIRLKLWRESQEDREYMELLRQQNKTAEVDSIVNTIYSGVTAPGTSYFSPYYGLINDINNIYSARESLAALLDGNQDITAPSAPSGFAVL